MVSPLSEAEARQYFSDHTRSRQYWVIPWFTKQASRLCEQIEATYYVGDASADFKVMMSPEPDVLPTTCFAKKAFLPAPELGRFLYGDLPPWMIDELDS